MSLSNLSVFYTQTNIKSETNNKLKYQERHWMKLLNCLMDRVPNQIIKIILTTPSRSMKHSDKPPVQIYVNKIQNRVMFKIESGFELLIPETMKLVGRTDERITKDKNSEHGPHLENTEVTLVHWSIFNNRYHRNSWVLPTFLPDHLVSY